MATAVRFNSAEPVQDVENIQGAPSIYYEDEEPPPDAYAKIQAYCESGGGDGKLAIYRVRDNQKEDYLCQINLSEFDPDLIKTRFGGGKFVVKGYDERKKIAMRQWLSIEGEPITEKTKVDAPIMNSAQSTAGIDAQTLLSIMQENNRQMLQGLAQILHRPEDAGNSRAQMLEEMRIMRDVFMPQQQNSQQSATDMLLKGIELAKTLSPIKSDGETTGMDVLAEAIRSFAPAISTVVGQVTNAPRAPAPAPQARQLPQNNQPPANAPQPIAQPQQSNEDADMFKTYVNMLLGFAKSGSDPALYADLIADRMTDEQIMELLNRPHLLQELAAINPEIVQYGEWFESLIAELKLIMGLTEPVSQNTLSQPVFTQPVQNVPVNIVQPAGNAPVDGGTGDPDHIQGN